MKKYMGNKLAILLFILPALAIFIIFDFFPIFQNDDAVPLPPDDDVIPLPQDLLNDLKRPGVDPYTIHYITPNIK